MEREEKSMTSPTRDDIAGRLDALEDKLARLETLLVRFTQQIERQRTDTPKVTENIQQWVTDYVSMRLQQLVPETCEYAPEPQASDGPYLPGTTVPCTDDVVHRVGRIPIPFVRQMVVEKVAQQACQGKCARIDVPYIRIIQESSMTVAAPVIPATITRKHILFVRLACPGRYKYLQTLPQSTARKPERVEESVHADLLIFA